MAFMLGGFADGLLGGAKAAMSLYGQYQQSQLDQLKLNAASAAADAMNDPASNGGAQSPGTQDAGGMDATPAAGSTYTPIDETEGAPDSGSTSANAPAADVSKLKWTPDSQKAAPAAPAKALPTTTTAQADGGMDGGPTTHDQEVANATSTTGGLGLMKAALSALPPPQPGQSTTATPQQPSTTATPAPQGLPSMQPQPALAANTNPQANPLAGPNNATVPTPSTPVAMQPQGGAQVASGQNPLAPAANAGATPPSPDTIARWQQHPPPAPTAMSGQDAQWDYSNYQSWKNQQVAGGANPQQPAAPPAPQASLGSSILSAINPIGTAQAAENPNGAPMQANQALKQAPAAALPAPNTPGGTQTMPAVGPGAPPPDSGLGPTASNVVAALRAAPPPASSSPAAATPSVVAAPPKGTVPPADAGATVVLPSGQAKVTPNQAGPTAQSEPSPTVSRPPFDPRPYAALKEQSPKMAALVDQIAASEHIDPARLAWHWNKESGFSTNVNLQGKDGAGSVGAVQMLPGTADMVDPAHTIPRDTLPGQLTLAARYINSLDTRYGANSPLSFAGYQGGTGSADAIQSGEGRYHPNTVAYMTSAFPGQHLDQTSMPPGLEIDPKAAIAAGTQGGPDGFIRYIAQSGAAGQPMSEKWRAAEVALVSLAAANGDTDGMRHAQDFVTQMSQQGTNTALQQAYQAINAGDTTGATQALARAHAFFPDGTMGRFGVDQSGQIWGQRVDEANPKNAVGPHFQVTADGVKSMLIQTLDPNKFREMVTTEQQANATRIATAQHGQYWGDLVTERAQAAKDRLEGQEFTASENNKTRDNVAAIAAATRTQNAQLAALSRQQVADTNAQGKLAAQALKTGSASQAGDVQPKSVDNEVSKAFPGDGSDPAQATWTPEQNDMGASVYQDLRMNSTTGTMNPVSAKSIATGVVNGGYLLKPVADGSGRFAVIPKATPNGQPRAIISGMVGSRIYDAMMGKSQQPRQALPVGPRPSYAGSALPVSR